MKISGALMILTLSAAPATCLAAACIDGHPSLDADFRRSALVVDARAVAVGPFLKDRDGDDYSRLRFQVLHTYKGPSRPTLLLSDSNTSAGLRPRVGERYVLFVRRRDGELYVDTCGASTTMASMPVKARARLERLGGQREVRPVRP